MKAMSKTSVASSLLLGEYTPVYMSDLYSFTAAKVR